MVCRTECRLNGIKKQIIHKYPHLTDIKICEILIIDHVDMCIFINKKKTIPVQDWFKPAREPVKLPCPLPHAGHEGHLDNTNGLVKSKMCVCLFGSIFLVCIFFSKVSI